MASDDREELDPKEIARADFPTAFRGYDQEAVRQYLSRVAVGMGRAQKLGLMGSADSPTTAELAEANLRADEAKAQADEAGREGAELQRRLDELEQQLDDAEARLEASEARGEANVVAGAARQLDESELIEQVAHDTAAIVKAARSSAAEIITRAEDEVKRITAEAEADAGRVHADADAVLVGARSEADDLVVAARSNADDTIAKANAEAKKTQTRIKAEAKRGREQAKVKADKTVAEASKKAESELAAARQRSTQLVADAEKRREEILGDLVRRRRVDQAQLDRLAAGRDQLAQALALARSQLDEISSDIDFAESSDGHIDLTEAGHIDLGHTDAEVAELVAELQEHTAEGGAGIGVGGFGESTAIADLTNGADHSNGRGAVITSPPPAPPDLTPPTPASPFDFADGNGGGHVGPDGPGQGPALADTAAMPLVSSDDNGSMAETDLDLDRRDSDGHGGDGHDSNVTVDELAESEYLDVDHDHDHDVDKSEVDVDRVDGAATLDTDLTPPVGESGFGFNGPINGDRLLDQLGFAPEPVLGTGAGSMYRTATRGDLPRNTPFNGRLPEAFEARDLALTRSTAGFRRRLKRAVNDDQSDVLDRLRAGKRAIEVDELPPLEEQLDRYVGALQPPLTEMVAAGGELVERSQMPVGALDNLCLQLARHIIHNLRLPTIDAIDAAVENDREAILDPVRAIYRDFRNLVLPDLIEDALHEAFALGLFDAIGPAEPVLWVTDPRLDPDPICEDNSASAPLVRGVNFPSGHPRPLSMPGCRCLVVPEP